MAGYVIAEVTVTDPSGFGEYQQQVSATIAAYGGRYLVRGGATEPVEGEWNPSRLVIVEFDICSRRPGTSRRARPRRRARRARMCDSPRRSLRGPAGRAA